MCISNFFFFFNDTATTEIYTLSLHDALPISSHAAPDAPAVPGGRPSEPAARHRRNSETLHRRPSISATEDRKSTRLNSSHQIISYAVFCLKKKEQPTSANEPVPTTPSLDSTQ